MKVYLKDSVLQAAQKRISWLFDQFDKMIVGHSGGKDSAVIFDLVLQEARRRKRLPVDVLFVDQELEWQSTIDVIRTVMYMEEVNPYWLQIPVNLSNATSVEQDWFKCWEPGVEWVRPKDDISIKENTYEVKEKLTNLFDQFMKHTYNGGNTAALVGGVRCEESPARQLALTGSATFKDATWGKKRLKFNYVSMYPLYDWSYTDIWKYIHDNGIRYNALYDAQYQLGIPVPNMRVSALNHETALWNLFYMQEFEPETFNRVAARLRGVDMTTKFNDDLFPKKLPFMFSSWQEYRDFLLEKLITDEKKRDFFRKHFKQQDEAFKHDERIAKETGHELFKGFSIATIHRGHVTAILANDKMCSKLDNLKVGHDNKKKRDFRKKYLEMEAAGNE